jgi:hypothetical protein
MGAHKSVKSCDARMGGERFFLHSVSLVPSTGVGAYAYSLRAEALLALGRASDAARDASMALQVCCLEFLS